MDDLLQFSCHFSNDQILVLQKGCLLQRFALSYHSVDLFRHNFTKRQRYPALRHSLTLRNTVQALTIQWNGRSNTFPPLCNTVVTTPLVSCFT